MNIDQIYPWNIPNCVYPFVINMLKIKEYTYHLIKVFIVSVGGITCNTSQVSSQALNNYISNCDDESFDHLF